MKNKKQLSISDLTSAILEISNEKWISRSAAPIYGLLFERKQQLNQQFEFTNKNMAALARVDKLLSDATLKVVCKAEELHRHAYQYVENDNFWQDFEIQASIRPNVDSICETHPILYAICSTDYESINNNLCSYRGSGFNSECDAKRYIDKYEKDDFRWKTRTRLDELDFCWTFHNLVDHTFFALEDIMLIPEFWCEVSIVYQQFLQTKE